MIQRFKAPKQALAAAALAGFLAWPAGAAAPCPARAHVRARVRAGRLAGDATAGGLGLTAG